MKKKRVKFETPFFTVIFWKIKRFDKDEAGIGIKDLIFSKFTILGFGISSMGPSN